MSIITVVFPDGNSKTFPKLTTCKEIALSISSGLAKNCIAAAIVHKAKREIVDISHKITHDCSIELITSKQETDDALELLRHSTTHLMAQAVTELYPNAKLAIGPVIENGFYYDFEVDNAFSVNDLPAIEKKMREIILRKYDIRRIEKNQKDALDFVKKQQQGFKVEIIQDIPENTTISFYQQGEFVDMCRGPHLPNVSFIKHFKLTKVSGSYWKGDSKGIKLQRIYGTAWLNKSSLDEYLELLKKAELSDHRRIAKQMDLFHQQPEAAGDIFWHPKGYDMFLNMQKYIRSKISHSYKEIKTPSMMKRELWEKSGHWQKFSENMVSFEIDNEDFAIKPMNCPGHVEVFKSQVRSYKDLPLYFSEFGCCTRWEPSGALHGIMRLRSFTQDDAHIFCTPEQAKEETEKFVKLLLKVYKDFGFENIKIKLSDRPEKRIGSDEIWDKSEAALKHALEDMNMQYTINQGEGAFYGPKLEFVLVDNLKRDWQCGTLQMDFFLPERLEATYIDQNSEKQTPIMLHRAILGSIERFIGILLENNAGHLPLWVSPLHIAICSFTNKQDAEAKKIHQRLIDEGIKSTLDDKPETVNYKIRKHSESKVPYIGVIGEKEIADKTITIRKLGEKGQKSYDLEEFIKIIKKESTIS